ncbi:sigma-70 family RNA polymerase sigma factor [Amycolatopsis sp. NPDC051102]|uniref:sigma-70 family RNA polymerase sigma factor n=1 Tax=Amycolatopsis sp. NPDC051102 TaxID=3155163 RepID=UPI00341A5A1E
MDRNEEAFDAWLTGQREEFDAAVRQRVDSAAVLRAIKHRSAREARREIDERVAVAATTGALPDSGPEWPSGRWEHVDADFAQLAEKASLQTYSEVLAAWHHKTTVETVCKLRRVQSAVPEPDWQDYGFNDCELFTALSRGQRGALVRIISLVRPLAYRYTRARLSVLGVSLEITDELAQRALEGLVSKLPTYRYRDGQPFLRFVYLVLKVEVGEASRTHQRLPQPELNPTAEDAEPVAAQLATMLGTLPVQQREVLVLLIVVGLSAKETATALDMTPGAVRLAQQRALAHLRKKILKSEMPRIE